VLATRNGLVKKTRLGDYNSPRQAGVIAINLRDDDDQLIGAELAHADDDILLVSRKGQAIRFRADDTQLRPMGRATSGVTGMKFRDGDELLSMSVIRAEQVAAEEALHHGEGAVPDGVPSDVVEQYVFTITDGGFAKRSHISDYRLQSRGGIGIKAMKQDDDRGNLVGAFIVVEGDEVLAIKQSGQVTRSAIDEHLRPTGRDTKGVRFVGVGGGDSVVVVARSVERAPEIDEAAQAAEAAVAGDVDAELAEELGADLGAAFEDDASDADGTSGPGATIEAEVSSDAQTADSPETSEDEES
jgi:DNA gyrase subunit A